MTRIRSLHGLAGGGMPSPIACGMAVALSRICNLRDALRRYLAWRARRLILHTAKIRPPRIGARHAPDAVRPSPVRLFGKACSEHRPSRSAAPVTPAHPRRDVRHDTKYRHRARRMRCRPSRGLTPYRPAYGLHADLRPPAMQRVGRKLQSPRPDRDISAPAKRRCRRKRYIIPHNAGNRCVARIFAHASFADVDNRQRAWRAAAQPLNTVASRDAASAGRKIGRLNRQDDGKVDASPRTQRPGSRAGYCGERLWPL